MDDFKNEYEEAMDEMSVDSNSEAVVADEDAAVTDGMNTIGNAIIGDTLTEEVVNENDIDIEQAVSTEDVITGLVEHQKQLIIEANNNGYKDFEIQWSLKNEIDRCKIMIGINEKKDGMIIRVPEDSSEKGTVCVINNLIDIIAVNSFIKFDESITDEIVSEFRIIVIGLDNTGKQIISIFTNDLDVVKQKELTNDINVTAVCLWNNHIAVGGDISGEQDRYQSIMLLDQELNYVEAFRIDTTPVSTKYEFEKSHAFISYLNVVNGLLYVYGGVKSIQPDYLGVVSVINVINSEFGIQYSVDFNVADMEETLIDFAIPTDRFISVIGRYKPFNGDYQAFSKNLTFDLTPIDDDAIGEVQ